MTTSKVPAVIDYLVTTFKAASTLAAVSVYDGPVTAEEDAELVLYVGMDNLDGAGPGAPAAHGADSQQQWAGLGHQARNEQLTIYCVAEAWSGDDVQSARVAAYGITSAVEDIVRNDASLGGLVSTPGNAAVTTASLSQFMTGPGAARAIVTFEITAQARIGG